MTARLGTAEMGSTVAMAVYGPLTRDDLKRYAQASGDSNPLHLDSDFARQAGFDDVIVHGMLGMAFLGRLITESFPEARLQLFRTRFRNVIPVGRAITCSARLERRDRTTIVLGLVGSISNDDAVVIEGSATLVAGP